MGIVHEGGHDTNIVFGSETYGNVWGPALLDDPLEQDPARRYKMLYERGAPGFRVADETPGAHIRLAHSPDGIHWTPAEEIPTFGPLGDQLGDTIFPTFDPDSGTYRIVTRHPLMELAPRTRPTHAPMIGGAPSFDAVMATPNRRVVRRIFMAESRDFLNWSEPRLILAPDPDLDNLDIAFYGMRPFRLGGHWIGFLGVFHQVSNTSTVELVHSRDGRSWARLAPTHDWIGLGEPGAGAPTRSVSRASWRLATTRPGSTSAVQPLSTTSGTQTIRKNRMALQRAARVILATRWGSAGCAATGSSR